MVSGRRNDQLLFFLKAQSSDALSRSIRSCWSFAPSETSQRPKVEITPLTQFLAAPANSECLSVNVPRERLVRRSFFLGGIRPVGRALSFSTAGEIIKPYADRSSCAGTEVGCIR